VNKQVSPLFAIIVIVVVVALGALYFLVRFRAAEERFARESRALQGQADAARRAGRGMMGGNRPGRGMRRGGSRVAPGGTVPGGRRQPSRQGETRGAERRGG
jgi:hypothetical protein